MADETGAESTNYIAELSERIRGLRAARGMTRKQLSHHSSISERYLAQLEAGNANPSVALLWRVAAALGVDFNHLLVSGPEKAGADADLLGLIQRLSAPDRRVAYEVLQARFGGPRPSRCAGIALIGLRGAGKTTLGRGLAARLELPFVRLTERIEALGGMEIGELFSLGGQSSYRRLERQALEEVAAAGPPSVLEVGGSLVSEAETFALLRTHFYTVWLRAQPREHMERVIRQGDMRPMEGDNTRAMADLERILAEREVEYARAETSLDTSQRTEAECLAELTRIASDVLVEATSQASV